MGGMSEPAAPPAVGAAAPAATNAPKKKKKKSKRLKPDVGDDLLLGSSGWKQVDIGDEVLLGAEEGGFMGLEVSGGSVWWRATREAAPRRASEVAALPGLARSSLGPGARRLPGPALLAPVGAPPGLA